MFVYNLRDIYAYSPLEESKCQIVDSNNVN